MGRPPLGERAMTAQERKRRWQERHGKLPAVTVADETLRRENEQLRRQLRAARTRIRNLTERRSTEGPP